MVRDTAAAHLTHPKYRSDIDGLRAIAVLSVVGFHAFPSLVKGGFVGVDIFFVISGYLISTIIFENLDRNAFSFREFYARRVKRIFPALLLVLIASLAVGWFALFADGYRELGKHVLGGAGFVSNLVLWSESGYFDSAAATKPLLHLWSLGIEEQFYIFWPLLLWFGWRRRLNLLAIAIAVAALSFADNLAQVRSDGVAAFYSPQTRFWELMVGSVLAYLQLFHRTALARSHPRWDRWAARAVSSINARIGANKARNVQSLIGAGLVLAGISLTSRGKPFPGYWALLPTMGAVLIISAGKQAWVNRTLLSNRVMVWFGVISYPLYLWHWPILSFQQIIEGVPATRMFRVGAVAGSILLAAATYYFLERPVRFGGHGKAKTTVLVAAMLMLAAAGYGIFLADGLPKRRVVDSTNQLVNALSGISNVYTFFGGNFRWGRCYSAPESVTRAQKMQDCVDPIRPLVFLWGTRIPLLFTRACCGCRRKARMPSESRSSPTATSRRSLIKTRNRRRGRRTIGPYGRSTPRSWRSLARRSPPW